MSDSKKGADCLGVGQYVACAKAYPTCDNNFENK